MKRLSFEEGSTMFSSKTDLISLDSIAQLFNQLGLLLVDSGPHEPQSASCQTRLVIDSRKVSPGAIFCAFPGNQLDGRDFIADAQLKGAQAVIWEPGIRFEFQLANYPVSNLAQYIGILAALSLGFPSDKIFNYAITGTNGKTSISHWLNQTYTFLGRKTAIIGTTGAGIYPQLSDFAATTPDPITLQSLICQFSQQEVALLAMEVSSHALEQGRVNGVNFNCAIFTNLTLDHLDYHQSMANYFAAKEKLFYWHGLEQAIINADDEYGLRLINDLRCQRPELRLLSYGLNSGELQAESLSLTKHGISFSLTYQGQRQLIHAAIIGRFNVYNLLAVIGSLLLNGVKWLELPQLIGQLTPVCGRMDANILANKPLVVVDYAHTPDALEKALSTLAEIKGQGRLICVFGCGGNRDTSKRPLMGEIAAKLADQVILTTDNPRFEDPQLIIDQVANLIPGRYQRISQRHQAITAAIAMAAAEDIVLIAGKGHENYQEIEGVKHHFSDLEVVAELLRVE